MPKPLEKLKVYGQLLHGIDFKVVTIHPLADEEEILNNLHLFPIQCTSCDLYWAFQGEVFFVSIMSFKNLEQCSSVSYHCKKNSDICHSFNIVINQSPIYKTTVNSILKYLSPWIVQNKGLLKKKISEIIKITEIKI